MYGMYRYVWDVSICTGCINMYGMYHMYEYVWDVSICMRLIKMYGMYQYVVEISI